MTKGDLNAETAERNAVLERLQWLAARLAETSSRLNLASKGRPYRDTARRQTLKKIRVQTAAVAGNVQQLERSLNHDPSQPNPTAEEARLFSAVARLLASARSSLELVGIRSRWSQEPRREEADVAETLQRDRGREEYLEGVRQALEETRQVLDEVDPAASVSRRGARAAERTQAWADLARRSLRLTEGWITRIERSEPRSAPLPTGPAGKAWLLAGLEAQTDYIEVLVAAAEILCRY